MMNSDNRTIVAIVAILATLLLVAMAMSYHHVRRMAEMGYVPSDSGWTRNAPLTPCE